jgi:carbohydrate kinase (thermoresistant glucokinase family)
MPSFFLSRIALTDEDRRPWLIWLAAALRGHDGPEPLIVAFSALKASYREFIDRERYELVYLMGSPSLISWRVARRKDHFMPPGLLESQFRVLEKPSDALTIPASLPPHRIVDMIICKLALD